MLLADIIYPAFYAPYVPQVLDPWIPLVALASEIAVLWAWYGRAGVGRLSVAVVLANIASSIVGVVVAMAMPSGLNQEFILHRTGPALASEWATLATIGWLVAFFASVAVEYPVLSLLTRARKLSHLFRAVSLANIVSYLVLYAAMMVAVRMQWS